MLVPADRVGDGAWRRFKGIILSLIEMGYSYEHAQEAIFRTQCRGVQEAVEWIIGKRISFRVFLFLLSV